VFLAVVGVNRSAVPPFGLFVHVFAIELTDGIINHEEVEGKRLVTVVIPVILLVGLILFGFSCAPQATLEVSVTELGKGVMIENVGSVDCLVFVTSAEGEQQFELAVGQNRTVTGMSQPIEVSAVRF
jgi:hypothetical protein